MRYTDMLDELTNIAWRLQRYEALGSSRGLITTIAELNRLNARLRNRPDLLIDKWFTERTKRRPAPHRNRADHRRRKPRHEIEVVRVLAEPDDAPPPVGERPPSKRHRPQKP